MSATTATATTSASPGKAAFADATRVLTSVLAPLEKRVLVAMARRMPARINSDHLTGLALVAMLGAGPRTGSPARRRSGSTWRSSASR